MKKRFIITLICISYVVVALSIYFSFNLLNTSKIKNEQIFQSETTTDCQREDIVNISLCLGHELEKWYKYNISNIGKELTFQELKELGGVCSHFAEWYKQELVKLGGTYLDYDNQKLKQKNESLFYITKNHIPITKDIGHVYTVISDEKYYCNLDQLNVKCTEFKR